MQANARALTYCVREYDLLVYSALLHVKLCMDIAVKVYFCLQSTHANVFLFDIHANISLVYALLEYRVQQSFTASQLACTW